MSKQKKAKKARRPNIPMAAGPLVATGGGMEGVSARSGIETTQAVNFDYTHIKKDLTRIGILAGSFIVILVVLSFIIR
jgi:hypothetical protein